MSFRFFETKLGSGDGEIKESFQAYQTTSDYPHGWPLAIFYFKHT